VEKLFELKNCVEKLFCLEVRDCVGYRFSLLYCGKTFYDLSAYFLREPVKNTKPTPLNEVGIENLFVVIGL
jgi:hypothetical protein